MKKILLAVLVGVGLVGQAAVFYPGGGGGGPTNGVTQAAGDARWVKQAAGVTTSVNGSGITNVPGTITNGLKNGASIFYDKFHFVVHVTGDATAAGTYTSNKTVSGVQIFTNSSVDLVYWQTNGTDITAGIPGASTIVSNSTIPDVGNFDGIMYGSISPYLTNASEWFSGNGVGTSQSGGFPQSFTSNVNVFMFSGVPVLIATNNIIKIDSVAGNDDSGAIGGPPFLTLTNALKIAQSNDFIIIGPGTYSYPGGVTVPYACSIIGSGPAATFFDLGTPTAQLVVSGGTNLSVGNFTILRGVLSYGPSANTVSSNTFIASVIQKSDPTDTAAIDGLFLGVNSNDVVTVKDCTFGSHWDASVIFESGNVTTNNFPTVIFDNCWFSVNALGGGSAIGHGMQVNRVNTIFRGGGLSVDGFTQTGTGAFQMQPTGSNNTVNFYNTRLEVNGGNTNQYAINFINAISRTNVMLHGFYLPTNLISGQVTLVLPTTQAGSTNLLATTAAVINLNSPFITTNYSVSFSTSALVTNAFVNTKTTNSFTFNSSSFTGFLDWVATIGSQ